MLYENVKSLCEKNRISVWALERSTGLANGTIGKWADGDKSPRVDTVKTIADYFGVTVDELLKSNK